MPIGEQDTATGGRIARIEQLLLPDLGAASPAERVRARTILVTSIVGWLICALSLVLTRLVGLFAVEAVLWLGLVGFLAVPAVMRWTRRYDVAALVFLATAFGAAFYAVAASGGMRSLVAIWLPLVPATALAVTGERAAFGSLGLLLAFAATMVGLDRAGLLVVPGAHVDGVPLDVAVIVVTQATFYLFMSFSRERGLEQLSAGRVQDEADRARAEATSRAKTAILASVSHELRTPVAGILGLADLLRDTPLDGLQDQWVRTIRSTGSGLLSVLDDLLDSARLEAGSPAVDRRPFAPVTLVEEVAAVFEPAARARGLTLSVQVDGAPPERVMGDPARLRQILFNLVGNALKFTREGGVTLGVRHVDGALGIEVSDSGIGIPSERLADVFTPFVQVSPGASGGGVGLGLSIARHLADALGGRVEVTSQLGKGSTFSVVLPAEPTTEHELDADDAPDDVTIETGHALRVLVAEDNPVNQMVLRAMLETLGHRVEMVEDGGQVLEATRRFRPDVVVMDVRLPSVDGLEATRRLRADDELGRTPIVALTANAHDEDRRRCLDAGMDAFLTKPVRRGQLMDVLRSVAAPAPPPVSGRLSLAEPAA